MAHESAGNVRAQVDVIYRTESRRVFATLVRLLGDFDLAEEALHEAFAVALEQWQRVGIPSNPRAWLITAARFRGIDAIRRKRRLDSATTVLGNATAAWPPQPTPDLEGLADDQLRLLFTCCRPDLPPDAQVALTLREVCGLTTEEIARAYLTRAPTIAQRIVRAKQRIREERIPYEVPGAAELTARRALVMRVIYLVFNEGYSSSNGTEHIRVDLCEEAIRLARLLADLLPDPETDGLLSLLLLQDARRAARTSPSGDIVLFAEQDRSLWNRQRIAEGAQLVERALQHGGSGTYVLQAAIAAVYAESVDNGSIDWPQIVALHDVLSRLDPSPVARLARAVAVAGRDGPEAGLALVDAILSGGELTDYLPAHAARADLCQRLVRKDDALDAYRRALGLSQQEPEQRLMQRRIAELENGQ
ncbi:MAG TPA: sigma-70 family RNA polymerase sigma factor [Polyangiaceae bacterium]